MLSQHVTFDETSVLKSTVSQQTKRTKTKDVSKRVDVHATSPPPVGSVQVKTSSDVTPGGDHVASFDAEQVDDIDECRILCSQWNQDKTTKVGEEA